jgi:hypothetical protein
MPCSTSREYPLADAPIEMQGDMATQQVLERALSTVYSCSVSGSKLAVLASFLQSLCKRHEAGEQLFTTQQLLAWSAELAGIAAQTRCDSLKSALSALRVLECLLCLSRMGACGEPSSKELLLQALEALFKRDSGPPVFQALCSEAQVCHSHLSLRARWKSSSQCHRALSLQAAGVRILVHAGFHPASSHLEEVPEPSKVP